MTLLGNIDDKTLLTFIFETRTGNTVIDQEPNKASNIIFDSNNANRVISVLTNQQQKIYTNKLDTNNSQFNFNYYTAGAAYIGDIKTQSLKLNRDFNTEKFLQKLKKSRSDLPFEVKDVKNDWNLADTKRKINFETQKIKSTNTYELQLSYTIPKLGWATEAQRAINAKTIKDKIGLGFKTKYSDMERIVKIMAFILAREKGYPQGGFDKSYGGVTYKSSEELYQREFGIICWAMINMCGKKYKNSKQGDLLELLKDKGYSNFQNDVKEVETQEETAAMKSKYAVNNKSGQNLEYFVLAFFDGWVNEECDGVTNWDHISSGIDSFSGFHLPKAEITEPDIGLSVSVNFNYKNGNQTKDDAITITIEQGDTNILKSNSPRTRTLDGNSLFMVN